MKTYLNRTTVRRAPGTTVLQYALFTLLGLSLPSFAGEPSPAPKDHALFVGSSLWVEMDGRSFEVIGASAHDAFVVVDGQRKAVPLDNLGTVRIERSLKLTDVIARIDKFECNEVESTGVTSPEMDQMRQSLIISSMVDYAKGQSDSLNRKIEMLDSTPKQVVGNFGILISNPMLPQAEADIAAAQGNIGSLAGTYNSSSTMLVDSTTGGVPRSSLEISGEFVLPTAAKEALLLVDTEYREKKSGPVMHSMYLHTVRNLGSASKRVQFVQPGFPRGFIFEKTNLHLFVDGKEVASNLSEKRVDLTADEALRYLVMCYVVSHTKDSLAASPLKFAIPANFQTQAKGLSLVQPLFVTVGADGVVRKLSADAAGNGAVDPYLDAVVSKFRFTPALKEGKPVESVVELKLSDYVH
jgi:hypothetical protein